MAGGTTPHSHAMDGSFPTPTGGIRSEAGASTPGGFIGDTDSYGGYIGDTEFDGHQGVVHTPVGLRAASKGYSATPARLVSAIALPHAGGFCTLHLICRGLGHLPLPVFKDPQQTGSPAL